MKIKRPELVEFVDPPPGYGDGYDESTVREALWAERVAAGGLGATRSSDYQLGWHAGFGDRAALTAIPPPTAPRDVDALLAIMDSAVEEFENIQWRNIWDTVAATDPALAEWSQKYVAYLKDDIDKAYALADKAHALARDTRTPGGSTDE